MKIFSYNNGANAFRFLSTIKKIFAIEIYNGKIIINKNIFFKNNCYNVLEFKNHGHNVCDIEKMFISKAFPQINKRFYNYIGINKK